MKIKVACPAKINLTLHVFKKDESTGFHPIESIMQATTLFDYLTVETTNNGSVEFSGNSKEISHDKNNLVIKALESFFESANIKHGGLKIYLEKNIPIASGLAGGSTDAAGMMCALKYIYKDAISEDEIYKINSKLGSDINFCYKGGCALCKGKGDEISQLPFVESDLTIVKPIDLKISTAHAYSVFDALETKSNLPNDLEYALLPHYDKLRYLHSLNFQMSGSGPSFFIKEPCLKTPLSKDYQVFENLKFYNKGVTLI